MFKLLKLCYDKHCQLFTHSLIKYRCNKYRFFKFLVLTYQIAYEKQKHFKLLSII